MAFARVTSNRVIGLSLSVAEEGRKEGEGGWGENKERLMLSAESWMVSKYVGAEL